MNRALIRWLGVSAVFFVIGCLQGRVELSSEAPFIGLYRPDQATPGSIDALRRARPEGDKLLYMPESGVMKVLALGQDAVLFDLMLIQATNYVMTELDKSPDPEYLKELFETLTSLNPQTLLGYRHGFLLLSAIAQRHQAALDLLAKADARHFEFEPGLRTKAIPAPVIKPVTGPRRWLDFKRRLIYTAPERGALHPKHAGRFLIARERAGFFVMTTRELALAGQEMLLASEAQAQLGNKTASSRLSSLGQGLIAQDVNIDERAQLKQVTTELEKRYKDSENRRVKEAVTVQLKGARTRLVELNLERLVGNVKARRRASIRSLSQLDRYVAWRQRPPDFYNTGYRFFPDGRVRSPGRVKAEAIALITAKLRAYTEQTNIRRPASLEAIGVTQEILPQDVRVTYSPTDRKIKVKFIDPVWPQIDPEAPATFTVRLVTTKGPIDIVVTRSWAPFGADRFHALVKSGFYDGCAFFRVIEGFMAQCGVKGDLEVDAKWTGKPIPDDPTRKSNTRGFVTFAKTAAPDSRTTQFFVNLADNKNLDARGFAPFGKLTDPSLAVLDALYKGYGEGPPNGSGPDQSKLRSEGQDYIEKSFPKLDAIITARFVTGP